MLVIAHRGFSGRYPENTMLAFRKALEAGADGIENDVQFTKDLVPVIMHDESVDRTTDGKGWLRDFTYDELRRLNVSYPSKFGEDFAPQSIPTLDEFLRWMAEDAVNLFTNIELKNSVYYYAGLEDAVIRMIRKYGLEERIILSSFNNASIALCKRIDPEIRCAFLYPVAMDNPGAYCRRMGVDYYHPDYRTLTAEQVWNCTQNGIGVNPWTVNDEESIRRVKKWGVNAVISNFPDIAGRIRDE
ncbi:MAG: glycerophosphodiester phosphodiesterase [Lachnospiraceae bacterium]|jgi:glycerophosphoryl diester phosphodiesterase